MAEVERPFDSDSMYNSPVAYQLFDPASMETFRSSQERQPKYSQEYVSCVYLAMPLLISHVVNYRRDWTARTVVNRRNKSALTCIMNWAP